MRITPLYNELKSKGGLGLTGSSWISVTITQAAGSQAPAWEPATNEIIQQINQNDDRARFSRQSTMSQQFYINPFLLCPLC
jgi:hypothetical protein